VTVAASRDESTKGRLLRPATDRTYPVDRLRFLDRLDVRDVDGHGLVV
jgi:hypothetical protein